MLVVRCEYLTKNSHQHVQDCSNVKNNAGPASVLYLFVQHQCFICFDVGNKEWIALIQREQTNILVLKRAN